eukprot:Seg2728.3 transcript_id=Seg2728.3/GoldUCD/mRNA.D3Y31 product="hypothetical protein" protein_id=Seg2728.3/GoldUCD/D3Y31
MLLFLQSPKCLQLSNNEQNTFQLIIGSERKDGMSMCPMSFFHECSISSTCNYVIKIKKTSKCMGIQDLKQFGSIADDLLVWEKIPKRHLVLQALPTTQMVMTPRPYTTCKTLKQSGKGNGLYDIHLPTGNYRVYCIMDVNNGGYTFLSNTSLSSLNSTDMVYLFTDRQSVLLRILMMNGSQPYTVVKQYTDTGGLSVQLNNYTHYRRPKNVGISPYLYVGTLPKRNATKGTRQGFRSNDADIVFNNCDGNANNYFAFFARTNGKSPPSPSSVYERRGVAINWRKSAIDHGTRMPDDYFYFTEMGFGGCGCYTESTRWRTAVRPALSASVGMR